MLCLLGIAGAAPRRDRTSAPRAKSQLAILPGTSHRALINRADWIVQLMTPFLDAK